MRNAGKAETNGQSLIMALSAAELAQALGVSLRHVHRMNTAGKIPRPIRLSRSVRWPIQEIQAWLAAGAPDRRTWEAIKEVPCD